MPVGEIFKRVKTSPGRQALVRTLSRRHLSLEISPEMLSVEKDAGVFWGPNGKRKLMHGEKVAQGRTCRVLSI